MSRKKVRGRGFNLRLAFREKANQMQDRLDNTVGYMKGEYNLGVEAKSVLRNYGARRVVAITLNRQPFTTMLNWLLQFVSGGTFFARLKETPYDNLFHLRALLKLDDGTTVAWEKTQTPKLSVMKDDPNADGAESLPVDGVPDGLTLRDCVDRTLQQMGETKFYTYNVSSNNCQVFVNEFLASIGVQNNTYYDWVKQDTRFVFEHNAYLRPLVNSATTLNRHIDYVTGAGIQGRRRLGVRGRRRRTG